jgi:hypothetical protein
MWGPPDKLSRTGCAEGSTRRSRGYDRMNGLARHRLMQYRGLRLRSSRHLTSRIGDGLWEIIASLSFSLARLLRADELSPVWLPDEGHEAMRDLVRCGCGSAQGEAADPILPIALWTSLPGLTLEENARGLAWSPAVRAPGVKYHLKFPPPYHLKFPLPNHRRAGVEMPLKN